MKPTMLSITTMKSRRFHGSAKYSEIPRPASLSNSSQINTKVQKLSSSFTAALLFSPGFWKEIINVLIRITTKMNASKPIRKNETCHIVSDLDRRLFVRHADRSKLRE